MSRRLYLAGMVLGLALAAVSVPATGAGAAPSASAFRAPHSAAVTTAVLYGRVLWAGTEQGIDGVDLQVTDLKTAQVVGQGMTDAGGWYTMTVGVGDWRVNIPTTARYYGYAQDVTALPHAELQIDFALRPNDAPRLPPAPPPGAESDNPAAVAPPAALTTPEAASGATTLPPGGQPVERQLWFALALLAAGLSLVGLALRRREDRFAKTTPGARE